MDSIEKNEYENICKLLKSLQQAKAPSNFEVLLFQKINSQEFTFTETNESFWSKLFSRYKLIPSAALAVLAVLIIYFFGFQPAQKENPFAVKPKVREDVIVADPFSSAESVKDKIEKKEESIASHDQNQSHNFSKEQPTQKALYPGRHINVLTASAISKSGLNFMHINPNLSERREIYKLKMHLERFFNDDSLLKSLKIGH
jgi:hypothetical protein